MAISSRQPLRCVGSIQHDKGKGAVGLAVDGRWLACATADCVSAWRLAPDAEGGGCPELFAEMRHEIASSQRRVVTHLALLGGLVLAAGESKVAKRRRESKGCLAQINPGVFVLACRAACRDPDSNRGQAAPGGAADACMSDLEIPSVMAEWKSFGGIALMDAGSSMLLAGSDGQIVHWTLDNVESAANPGARQGGRGGSRGSSSRLASSLDSDRPFRALSISRCCTLPPATGHGQLRSIAICGRDGRFAVGALQHAVHTLAAPPTLGNTFAFVGCSQKV